MGHKKKSERKRYIAFKVNAPREITRGEFITAIKRKVPQRTLWGEMTPWLTVFENNRGILRCAHTCLDEAIKLLSSITQVGGGRVEVVTLGTSGTIKKAKQRYLVFGEEK